ncbi:hypothetical protein GCM10009863_36360 [Streptomyces axinellae]|uniref:Uncharacterized protein n=1 Tax=Streptomyces axinellae TaxID=552788 RepID=A0ABN3Q7I0_9ACTN
MASIREQISSLGRSPGEQLRERLRESESAVMDEWNRLFKWRSQGEQLRREHGNNPQELDRLVREHDERGRTLFRAEDAVTLAHLQRMEGLREVPRQGRLARLRPISPEAWQSAWTRELDAFWKQRELMMGAARLPHAEPAQAASAQPQPQQHASQAAAPQQQAAPTVATGAGSSAASAASAASVAAGARASRPQSPNSPSGSIPSHHASSSSSRSVSSQPGPSASGPTQRRRSR